MKLLVDRVKLFVGLLLLVPFGPDAATADAAGGVQRIATIDHLPLAEVSGIARSERYPGIYWVHNDSGDEARIFAIDSLGKVVFPAFLAELYHGESAVPEREPWPGLQVPNAANIDWEDIALAEGRLFIADVGNNANARRDLGIYVLNEPNPRATWAARALRYLPVRYPEQESFPPRGTWLYDSEAVFVFEEKLYLLTRHRREGEPLGFTSGTRLYRLDTQETDSENVLRFVDSHDGLVAVGGADLSPDGERLAVLTYRELWVFERPQSGDRWLSGETRKVELALEQTKQVEAVCWDDAETLRITNEQREIFRVPLSALVAAERTGGGSR